MELGPASQASNEIAAGGVDGLNALGDSALNTQIEEGQKLANFIIQSNIIANAVTAALTAARNTRAQ